MTAGPLLQIRDVTVQFGALKAVDGVSITLEAGARRAVIGPNGAGKTTLFNAITGTAVPAAGRILFDGSDITRMPPSRRAHLRITRTFQITNLFGQLTVLENMRLASRGLSRSKFAMLGKDRLNREQEVRVAEALAAARLAGRENSRVKLLSHGEQRQLEVAMALAADPRLLLLDEPAAGLSPAERQSLAEIIRSLPQTMSIVLIEHDMDLALGLAGFVTVMQNGKVIVEDEPGKIRGNPAVQEVYLGQPHQARTSGGAGPHA
jgi:branched-chain amino acid transport system ATP-binding protein